MDKVNMHMVHTWCLCHEYNSPSTVSQPSPSSLFFVFWIFRRWAALRWRVCLKRQKISQSSELQVRDQGKTPGVWTRRKDSAPWGLRDIQYSIGIRDNLFDGTTEDQRTAGDKQSKAGGVMFFADCQDCEDKEALTHQNAGRMISSQNVSTEFKFWTDSQRTTIAEVEES